MKIIGIGKDDGIIVQMTENEMLKVSGVAGKTQIAHRFKPGMDINIAPMYLNCRPFITNNCLLLNNKPMFLLTQLS